MSAIPFRSVASSAEAKRSHNPTAAWRHIDFILVGAVALLNAIGLTVIFSATRHRSGVGLVNRRFLENQAISVVLGVAVMVAIAAIDYTWLKDKARWWYGATIAVLAMVVSPFGAYRKGQQSWFQIGGFQFQPSEVAKVTVILMIALVVAGSSSARSNDPGERMSTGRLVGVLVVVGVAVGFIMLQPDLGTALVFAAITLAILTVAGAKFRHILALILLAVAVSVAALSTGVLKDYQKARLFTFVNPGIDRAASYNLNQSKIAIGSGGLTGQGLFKGRQTRLSYVPEQQTDFVFTVIGEELGLVGSAAVVSLFAVMIWRCWKAAKLAKDMAGRVIAAGVMALLMFQIFENAGMTMGIMPVTGIPLPFISYGGSAVISYLAAIGLVLNVHMRRFS